MRKHSSEGIVRRVQEETQPNLLSWLGNSVQGIVQAVTRIFDPYQDTEGCDDDTQAPVTTAPGPSPATLAPTNSPPATPAPTTSTPTTATPTAATPTLPPRKEIDIISKAFKTDAKEPNLIATGQSLFQLTAADVTIQHLPRATHKRIASTSATTAAAEFAVGVGLDASYGAFSLAAQVSTSDLNSRSKKTVRLDQVTIAQKHTVQLLTPVTALHNKLRPEIKDILLTQSVQNIVSNVGQFFATQLKMGASLQVVSSQNSDRERRHPELLQMLRPSSERDMERSREKLVYKHSTKLILPARFGKQKRVVLHQSLLKHALETIDTLDKSCYLLKHS